jgi:hypothetical protein
MRISNYRNSARGAIRLIGGGSTAVCQAAVGTQLPDRIDTAPRAVHQAGSVDRMHHGGARRTSREIRLSGEGAAMVMWSAQRFVTHSEHGSSPKGLGAFMICS